MSEPRGGSIHDLRAAGVRRLERGDAGEGRPAAEAAVGEGEDRAREAGEVEAVVDGAPTDAREQAAPETPTGNDEWGNPQVAPEADEGGGASSVGEADGGDDRADQPDADPTAMGGVTERLRAESAALDAELDEIRMLVTQARTEAARHEEKRVAAVTRLDQAKRPGNEAEALDLATQLATLTRRAAVMQAQVDVLEGKLKVLARYRDSLVGTTQEIASMSPDAFLQPSGSGRGTTPGMLPAMVDPESAGPGVSRIVLAAQEDLRREIARTMHDGPAQSLTNIVLQAQIVDRLVGRDPERAAAEVRQLISMVQQTLDATKSFIFDVRPMVLDDLGLVPTIRRVARDRGRKAQIPVDFESLGTDRRLPMDIESGLFRIIDEALAVYLEARPERVVIRLDWADDVEARIHAVHPPRDARDARAVAAAAVPEGFASREGAADAKAAADAAAAAADADRGRMPRLRRPRSSSEEQAGAPMPAALAAMIESNQRAANRASGLSGAAWRDIRQRAATLGLQVELLDDGRELRLTTAAELREHAG